MSFSLTADAVRAQTKTVTRRLGWLMLRPGDAVQPCLKCMGLKKGEKPQRIGGSISITSVRREPLRRMIDDPEYGMHEVKLEGFHGNHSWGKPEWFVRRFCETHRGCTPATIVTRIEFAYDPV